MSFTPNLDDGETTSVFISEKKIRTWMSKNGGGSQEYSDVWSNKELTEPLSFALSDVRTFGGIRTNKYNTLFVSFNLSAEQSKRIKKIVGEPLFNLIYDNKHNLLKNASKIKSKEVLEAQWSGVVQDGAMKPDGSGDCYSDQITGTVEHKKVGKQVIPHPDKISIVDLSENDYSWASLDGEMKEVIFEITKVTYKNGEVRPRLFVRRIVPNQQAAKKFSTKRTMKQVEDNNASPVEIQKITELVAPVATASLPVPVGDKSLKKQKK
jgi:hypothetical protein